VFEGVSADVLRKGPGHVPGTAYPGRAGNCVIAGHRDSFFRRRVYVTAGSEKREYCLVRRRVVAPGEVGVLAPTAGERLTLLTRYPFAWVGPAPRRVVWQGPPASSAGLPQDGLASAGTRARPRGEH
jgi:sortase A